MSSCSTSVTADIPVLVTTRAGAVLELRERVGELRARRISAARVVELARLVESLERERRREMNRRDDGAVLAIRGDAGADGARRVGEVLKVAHERMLVESSSRRMAPSAADSVRKASWPLRLGRSTSRQRSGDLARELFHLRARHDRVAFGGDEQRRVEMLRGVDACRSPDSESARNRSARQRAANARRDARRYASTGNDRVVRRVIVDGALVNRSANSPALR